MLLKPRKKENTKPQLSMQQVTKNISITKFRYFSYRAKKKYL